jgi:hypothetical protein
MKIELTQKEIDRIYFTIKNYVKNSCDVDYLLELSSDQKNDYKDELELIKKFSNYEMGF